MLYSALKAYLKHIVRLCLTKTKQNETTELQIHLHGHLHVSFILLINRGSVLLQWQSVWSWVHQWQCIPSISETLYYSLFLFPFFFLLIEHFPWVYSTFEGRSIVSLPFFCVSNWWIFSSLWYFQCRLLNDGWPLWASASILSLLFFCAVLWLSVKPPLITNWITFLITLLSPQLQTR